MTGDPLVLDRPALRDALAHMRIESPDGTSLEEALAREQGWTLAFAERVADEYCGFLYLAATAGFEVTPSRSVDQAWHLHLSWPHYREMLCGQIIGRPIEHRPGTGEPEDEARCLRQYEETLALYEQVFGKPPPPDIWPRPAAFEEEDGEAWETRQRSGRRKLVLAGAATILASAMTVQAPPWADVVLACVVAGLALSVILPRLGPGRRRSNAGCGGGGSDSDGGSSCGASCGGGCGGD